MKLYLDYGLPFAEIDLAHSEKSVKLSRVLIDTGSATTIISTETAIELDWMFEKKKSVSNIVELFLAIGEFLLLEVIFVAGAAVVGLYSVHGTALPTTSSLER